METRDGTEDFIPNEDIITQQVINWSHNDERVRLKVPVRVPHDFDLDQVIALMREAATRPHRILTSPAPNVLILSFGETAIELEMRFWIADAQHGVHNVKSEALRSADGDGPDVADEVMVVLYPPRCDVAAPNTRAALRRDTTHDVLWASEHQFRPNGH